VKRTYQVAPRTGEQPERRVGERPTGWPICGRGRVPWLAWPAAWLTRGANRCRKGPGNHVQAVEAWYAAAVEGLRAAGVTKGCEDDPPSCCPDDVVTRVQMASFLARVLVVC